MKRGHYLNGNTPKVAAIGCGHWGKNIARNLARLGALHAVCDSNPAAALRVSTDFGVPALSFDEIAAVLTEGLGRPISYHAETLEEAYASRAQYGAPDWQVDAWVSTYTAIAQGEVAAVSDDIPRLSGHPATSLAELLRRGSAAY